VKVEWFGQAAFLLTSEAGLRIITDPYDPVIGYGEIAEEADVATVSHEHRDHNYVAGLKGSPQAVKETGLHEAKGIQFKGTATFHDKSQGSERGSNTIFCFSLDGIRVCHLGDLGHPLSAEQIAEIGQVEVLLTPVGGGPTINAAEATELINKLRPQVVIPMHFRTEKAALRFAAVDDFLADKKGVTRLDSSTYKVKKENLPEETQIVVLKPSR